MRTFIARRNIFLLLAALMTGLGGFRGHSALTGKPCYEAATVQEAAIAQTVDAAGEINGVDHAPSVAATGGKVCLVKIAIEDVPGTNRGMSGDAQIVLARHQDGFVIPRRPIQMENGEKTVTILENDTSRKQAVEVGLTSPTSVEVVDGLSSGQKLVLGGAGL